MNRLPTFVRKILNESGELFVAEEGHKLEHADLLLLLLLILRWVGAIG